MSCLQSVRYSTFHATVGQLVRMTEGAKGVTVICGDTEVRTFEGASAVSDAARFCVELRASIVAIFSVATDADQADAVAAHVKRREAVLA